MSRRGNKIRLGEHDFSSNCTSTFHTLKIGLHATSPYPLKSQSKFNIVLMQADTWMGKIVCIPIPPIKVSVKKIKGTAHRNDNVDGMGGRSLNFHLMFLFFSFILHFFLCCCFFKGIMVVPMPHPDCVLETKRILRQRICKGEAPRIHGYTRERR